MRAAGPAGESTTVEARLFGPIEVAEGGRRLGPRDLGGPKAKQVLELLLMARGRGVAIMHAVMDTVRFSSEPEAGTVVHLVKHIDFEPNGPLAQLNRRRHA